MTEMQMAIKDKLETGIKNRNGGYKCWLEWCNSMYDENSMYNVYGQHLTIQQYQEMMGKFFDVFDMEFGQFHNMIIEDNWAAIRYDVHCIKKADGEKLTQQSMEFVRFRTINQGVVIEEGWACRPIRIDV